MKSYKLFIFDWDGTIMDSSEALLLSMIETAQDLKLPQHTKEEIQSTFGLPLIKIIELLYPDINPEIFAKAFYEKYASNSYKVNPFVDVTEILEYLFQKGHILAIATNKIRSELMSILEHLNWQHFFSATKCGDDEFVKPHPQTLLDLLKNFDLLPEEVIFIGDSECDMLTASNAKIDAIAVCHGVSSKEKLLQHKPIMCINDFFELKEKLLTLEGKTFSL